MNLRHLHYSLIVLAAASVLPTIASAQTIEYYTYSYQLGARHNTLDANYGMLCYGTDSIPEYQGFWCEDGEGTAIGSTGTTFQSSEVAVGWGQRVWSFWSVTGVMTTSANWLEGGYPGPDFTACTETPDGGEIENMWSAGGPTAHLISTVPSFPNFLPVILNRIEVLMTDRSVWRMELPFHLDTFAPCEWTQVVPPGDVAWAGSWWDAATATPYRMEVRRITQPTGDVWRTFYCDSEDNCFAASLDVPLSEVSEVTDPFSQHKRIPISQESYFETQGEWSRVQVLQYPSEYERVWTPLADWDQAVEHNGEWFPTEFFPHQDHHEDFVYEYIAGSRGFTSYQKISDTTLYGPGGVPIGFYTGDNARQHVIYFNPPPNVGDPGSLPPWQQYAQALDFWQSGVSQPLLRTLAFEQSGSTPDKPWIVMEHELGGPVYEVPPGWHEIPSRPRDTFELPATIQEEIALDVNIPAGSEGWIGGIQLRGELRAADLGGTHIGNISLNDLPTGEWVEVSLPLPNELREAFMGQYPGSRISTFVNAGVPGIQVRGLRTKGDTYSDVRSSFTAKLRPDVTTFALFDFEEPGGWMTTEGYSIQKHGLALSGDYVAEFDSMGWTQIESREFATSEIPYLGQTLTVDVRVPPSLPNPYWGGALQAHLSCPSQGMWNAYIGQQNLTYLFTGRWNTVEFSLPYAVREVLMSDATDCRLSFSLNVHEGMSHWRLDRVGFAD